MKALFSILVTIFLLCVLFLGACATPAPAPAPAPAPTPIPTPAPSPTPAPKLETTQIHIHGASPASPGQIMSFAWGDLINKNSSWLRTTISEEAGPGAAAPLFLKMPEKRKNSMMAVILNLPEAWSQGRPPLTPATPYNTWRIVAGTLANPLLLVTFDPNIKTVHDLKGKKLSIMPKGLYSGLAMENVIKYGAGILDQVKTEELLPIPAKDALLSGLIDASQQVFATDAPMWAVPPYVQELLAAKKLYYVDMTKEAIDKTYAQAPFPYFPPIQVPAGTYAPDQEAFWGLLNLTIFVADIEMPEEIVYEALSIMYEHADEFGQYHFMGKAFDRERMGRVPFTEEQMHPAAIRFYKEKGIQIGIPGS